MKKIATIIALWVSVSVSAQIKVSGVVKDKTGPMPGIMIIEKGTSNTAQTDANGQFSFTVSNENSVLEIFTMGYITQEIPVKGKTYFEVKLKEFDSYELFDAQRIGIYLNSGVINNPLGAELQFSSPNIFKDRTFTSSLSYQTDGKDNSFTNFNFGLNHVFHSNGFNSHIKIGYKKLDHKKSLHFKVISLESHLYFNSWTTIIGFSSMDYANALHNKKETGTGVTLGMQSSIGSGIEMLVKTTIYRNLNEYFIEMNKQFGNIHSFIRYNSVDGFNEISLGIGYEFHYKSKN